MLKIKIDSDKCIDCGKCENVCPMDVKLLEYKNNNQRILSTECILCSTLKISAGNHTLNGFLYGAENKKGLIIVSPGHRDPNDVKLYEIMYFVDNGWMVLCYDYTGCYSSEGNSMIGYVQAPKDLNTVIAYVETNTRFGNIPVLLFGHSLGGYASTAVLQFGNKVTAIVAASGFDDPKEQWDYSVKKSTGFLGMILEPYAGIYIGEIRSN